MKLSGYILHFIAGIRDSESKLNLFEALIVNDNLMVAELLQFIQHRTTQEKSYAESSVNQSNSSVVAYAGKCSPKN